MKRDPSIHLLESDLTRLLSGILDPLVVQRLLQKAKAISCTGRSMLATGQKESKKAHLVLQASKKDADTLANVIYATRVKMQHRGVKKISEGDRDWPLVKELAGVINKFAKEFELQKREAYIKYIDLAFKSIKTMRGYLHKLRDAADQVYQEMDAQLKLQQGFTQSVHDIYTYYVSKIIDMTGISLNLDKDAKKMSYFVEVEEHCNSINGDPYDYIDAQFEALEWCNSYPEPAQLVGQKAIERFTKYLVKHKKTLGNRKKEEKKINWNKLGL